MARAFSFLSIMERCKRKRERSIMERYKRKRKRRELKLKIDAIKQELGLKPLSQTRFATKNKETLKVEALRQKLVLATLSHTRVVIKKIRSNEPVVGLRPYEVSFISLLDKITTDSIHEINETGTTLKYEPGSIVGGDDLVHDCGLDRSIGYFIEPLIPLALFARKPLTIKLKGITNGSSEDLSVDTIISTTFSLLKLFGVPSKGLCLRIERRGVAPHGGGEVTLSIPTVSSLSSLRWILGGGVESVKCSSFSIRPDSEVEIDLTKHLFRIATRYLTAEGSRMTRVEPERIADPMAPRDMIRPLRKAIKDIVKHHVGSSLGYGISLSAKTSYGCLYSADFVSSEYPRAPTNIIIDEVVKALVEEIEIHGVVDTRHQGLLFLLCSLTQKPYVSEVLVGKLTPFGRETLKNIKKFLKVRPVVSSDHNDSISVAFIGCKT